MSDSVIRLQVLLISNVSLKYSHNKTTYLVQLMQYKKSLHTANYCPQYVAVIFIIAQMLGLPEQFQLYLKNMKVHYIL